MFRQLAVFVDGVDVDTAERFAVELAPDRDPGEILARLVDASMIVAGFEGGTRYRMLETLRAYGLDRLAAAGEDDDASRRFLRWAVELTGRIDRTLSTEREPEADAPCVASCRTRGAAWRLARDRGSLDDAAAIVVGLFEAIGYRDLIEIRGWAEELADDPALARPLAGDRGARDGRRGRLPRRRLRQRPIGWRAVAWTGRRTPPVPGTA